jgi:NHL repeat
MSSKNNFNRVLSLLFLLGFCMLNYNLILSNELNADSKESSKWSNLPTPLAQIAPQVTHNIFNNSVLGQDIAVGPDNLIYVVDGYTDRITVFDKNSSNYIREWGTNGNEEGEFNECSSIDINSTGAVYVADRDNNRIQVFNSTGGFLFEFGVMMPTGIDILPNGTVYVAEGDNGRIDVFYANGTLNRWFISIASPNSIAVTEDYIIVGESGGVSMMPRVYYHNGTMKADLSGGFHHYPGAITTNESNYIFITENDDCRIHIYRPDLSYYGNFSYKTPTTGELVGIAFMEPNLLVISDNYQYNITILSSSEWDVPSSPLQIPTAPLPTDLVYQIKYLGNIIEWWKFTGFYYVKNAANRTLYAQVKLWSSVEKLWKLHPDFPNSSIPVGVWNNTADIWHPHHSYSGAWGIDGNRGHSKQPIIANSSLHYILMELPNLLHYFTGNASALETMYKPDNSLLKTGETFHNSTSGNMSIYDKRITDANDNAVIANELANEVIRSAADPYVTYSHQKVSTTKIGSLSVMNHYFRETSTSEFEMVLDLNWTSTLCNITQTYWGKQVGDTIETEELIDGEKYTVTYEITTIDDCTVRQIRINEEMIATKDPVFGVPCSSVYAQKRIWNSTLNAWVNVTGDDNAPSSAQNSGQTLLGASFTSMGLPFIWSNDSESPLFGNASALTMMMLMPLSTGGPKPSSVGNIYPNDIRTLGKMFPYIKNVTGPSDHPRLTFEANDTDFLLDVGSDEMYASFNYGGIPCYMNVSYDSNSSTLSYTGYLPSKDGFKEYSVKFVKYTSVNAPSETTPPAGAKDEFNFMDYIWYLVIGIALIGAAIIVTKVSKKSKKEEVAEGEEPKMDFKI